jgi:hypothetical protein
LMDDRTKRFTCFDLDLLSLLARRALAELELREVRAGSTDPRSSFEHLAWVDDELEILSRRGFCDVLHSLSFRCCERREPLVISLVEVEDDRRGALERLKAGLSPSLFGRLGRNHLGVLTPNATADQVREQLRRATPKLPFEVTLAPRFPAQARDAVIRLEAKLRHRTRPVQTDAPSLH